MPPLTGSHEVTFTFQVSIDASADRAITDHDEEEVRQHIITRLAGDSVNDVVLDAVAAR